MVRCTDESLYTGITKDVGRRCEQHNAGTASRYTRSRLPVTLEYQEEHETQSTALKRELAIKALSRRAKEALISSFEVRHRITHPKSASSLEVTETEMRTLNRAFLWYATMTAEMFGEKWIERIKELAAIDQ